MICVIYVFFSSFYIEKANIRNQFYEMINQSDGLTRILDVERVQVVKRGWCFSQKMSCSVRK